MLRLGEFQAVARATIGQRASEDAMFSVCGVPIKEVNEQVYVGYTLKSTGQLLRNHYDVKREQALAAGRLIWSFEQQLGDIPPSVAIHLFNAFVAPHLLYGCEIALDIHPSALDEMQDVVNDFCRRLMGLGTHSMTDILRSETGIKELRYWRLLLALAFLRYVIACPVTMWVRCALWDALLLDFDQHRSWISDLRDVINGLPFPCTMPVLEEWLDGERIERLEKEITRGMDAALLAKIEACDKLYLIHGRVEIDPNTGKSRRVARMRRPYLDIAALRHRKALTRVLVSNHKMAVEIWQYAKTPVPIENRVCRFGCDNIESPEHIWLQCCRSPALVAARTEFQQALSGLCTGEKAAALALLDGDVREQLRKLISMPKCVAEVAKYAYMIETILDKTPLQWR
ncbi:hypothetical protein NMY22_g4120 [Coprinellus aureogranulatus]|nr:hypothetical protein NMY22_g4120 [Coprinellus aureogranulatus]